jgi:hypothetical protein
VLSCEPKPAEVGVRDAPRLSAGLKGGRTGVTGAAFGLRVMISNSGVNRGMTSFQVLGRLAPGADGGFVGVCRRTTSCHFSQMGSVM